MDVVFEQKSVVPCLTLVSRIFLEIYEGVLSKIKLIREGTNQGRGIKVSF